MTRILTHSFERCYCLHLINKSGLHGLDIINSLVTFCYGKSYSIG